MTGDSADRRLEAVIFDLDDTLHDDSAAYYEAASRTAQDAALSHGVDATALRDAYVAQADGFWQRLSRADLATSLAERRLELWAAALVSIGIRDPSLARVCADRYNALRREHLQLFPGTLELLGRLRDAGLKLGLLTNGFAETHREKIALLNLEQCFDAIFIADEIGLLKPDPLIFEHACRVLSVEPKRAAMVGDRYNRDVAGAAQIGMFTVWVNIRAEKLPAGLPRPDAVVAKTADAGDALLGAFKKIS